MSAMLASVSTFWTSVGRPRTPRSNGRGGTKAGLAGPPFSHCTSALSSPATKRSGSGDELDLLAAAGPGTLVDRGGEAACDALVASAADRDRRSGARRLIAAADDGAVEHEVRD